MNDQKIGQNNDPSIAVHVVLGVNSKFLRFALIPVNAAVRIAKIK